MPFLTRTFHNGSDIQGRRERVVFGNGVFVSNRNFLFGSSSLSGIDYSSDGINWQQANTGAASQSFVDLHFANGIFMAVGASRVWTSSDGITWTARNTTTASNWSAVTFGGGRWVVVSGFASIPIMVSDNNGITWTTTTVAPPAGQSRSLAFGAGVFVVVSNAGGLARMARSTDGINWTAVALPALYPFQDVTFGDGVFVAVMNTNNLVARSTDGINWTMHAVPAATWISVAHGYGMFAAISQTTAGSIMLSSDGITWTSGPVGSAIVWGGGLAFGKGQLVGSAQVGGGPNFFVSPHTLMRRVQGGVEVPYRFRVP
jgi:hypothetical protein